MHGSQNAQGLADRRIDTTVNYKARFWTKSPQHDALEAGIEMPADIISLQAMPSFAADLHGGKVTPGGGVTEEPEERGDLAQAS